MDKVVIFTTVVLFFIASNLASAQAFRVQIAAYTEQQPASFFNERGVDSYVEAADKSGIFWYSAGNYATREEAEAVHQAIVMKGFANALIIDQEEQRILAGMDCPYIRDGVVFTQEPIQDPSIHTIYFGFGQSSLDTESKDMLDAVFQKMKANPALTLKILGFTDGVGDAVSNMNLAAVRSRSARDYLIYKGVRADRMFMEVFGEAEPAAPNAEDDGSNAGKGRDLPENRKWNRRVTLTLETPSKAPNPTNAPK